MQKNNRTSQKMYGISRIDDKKYNIHAWRVSLTRRGKRHVKNFPDKKYGSRQRAFESATVFRDKLISNIPPISRREFCEAKRRNNQTGITGVCKYAKSYTLKDGTLRETWYWEANWPGSDGKNISVNFSINRFGEDMAKRLAIRARENGMQSVNGTFWAAERGEVKAHSGQKPHC